MNVETIDKAPMQEISQEQIDKLTNIPNVEPKQFKSPIEESKSEDSDAEKTMTLSLGNLDSPIKAKYKKLDEITDNFQKKLEEFDRKKDIILKLMMQSKDMDMNLLSESSKNNLDFIETL